MNCYDEGGPAFPWGEHGTGMTLRDYFAAKAMAAWMERAIILYDESDFADAAQSAYQMADAMLKARQV